MKTLTCEVGNVKLELVTNNQTIPAIQP